MAFTPNIIIVRTFSPPEYCRLFAQKKAYQGGGHGHPRTPPSYAPDMLKFDYIIFSSNSMAKFEVHVTGTLHLNISDNSAVPENIHTHPQRVHRNFIKEGVL